MSAHVRPVESASTYFARRARQERENATGAASAEARTAHLELAVRLVKVATEPALWGAWSAYMPGGRVADRRQTADGVSDLGDTLTGAFPLQPRGSFEDLLNAMDETDNVRGKA